LVNQQVKAGYHSVMWNATSDMGSPVSAGVYIYTITANDFRDVKKMVLLK
jgi:flagellar hook assembly protein FlgD